MDQDMRPPFHLISQFPGLIPFSQQKGLRVQKRVHFSPNQTNQIYINMIEAIFDSESGTTILKNPPTRRVFAFGSLYKINLGA